MSSHVSVKFGKETFEIDIQEEATISELQNRIEEKTGILSRNQKLLFKGKTLSQNHSLKDAGIQSKSKIMLLATQGIQTNVVHLLREKYDSN